MGRSTHSGFPVIDVFTKQKKAHFPTCTPERILLSSHDSDLCSTSQ